MFWTQKGMNLTQFVEVFYCVQEWTIPWESWDVFVISFLLGLTTLCFPCFFRKAKSYNSHHGHVRDTVVRQIADISSNNVALWQEAC